MKVYRSFLLLFIAYTVGAAVQPQPLFNGSYSQTHSDPAEIHFQSSLKNVNNATKYVDLSYNETGIFKHDGPNKIEAVPSFNATDNFQFTNTSKLNNPHRLRKTDRHRAKHHKPRRSHRHHHGDVKGDIIKHRRNHDKLYRIDQNKNHNASENRNNSVHQKNHKPNRKRMQNKKNKSKRSRAEKRHHQNKKKYGAHQHKKKHHGSKQNHHKVKKSRKYQKK